MTPRDPTRHLLGLTLVEVLASTVLLALMASVCVPLLQGSIRALRPATTSVPVVELAALADAFVLAPGSFGDETLDLGTLEMMSLGWPDDPDRPEITVTRLAPAESDVEDDEDPTRLEYVWLAFTCADVTLWRWVAIAEEDEP